MTVIIFSTIFFVLGVGLSLSLHDKEKNEIAELHKCYQVTEYECDTLEEVKKEESYVYE